MSITDTFAGLITLNITSGSSFTFLATDGASGISAAGTLAAPIVVLQTGSNGINFTGANSMNANDLTVSSTGVVNIADTYAGVITLRASSGSSFTLTDLATASGILAVGALDAATVNVTAGSGGIDFTGANTLNASALSALSTGVVNLLSTNTGTTTLNASSGSTFRFETPGGISINGDINSVGLPAGTLQLLALGSTDGNITTTGTGRIYANDARLTANGTIGIGASGNPLATSFSILTVYAPMGSVYISNDRATGMSIQPFGLGGQSLAGGTLSINQTVGDLSVAGPVYAGTFASGFVPDPLMPISASDIELNGDILLTAAGNLTLASGLELTARGGSIILDGNATSGGDSSTFNAWGGDIIVVGSSSVSLVAPTPSTMQAVGTSAGDGGGIAIASGMSLADVQTELGSLKASRVFPLTLNIDANPGIVTGNTFNLSNGATLKIAGNNNNIVGNTFSLSGGVMFINDATIDPFTFTSRGLPVAPPVPPSLGGSNGSGANTSTNLALFVLPAFANGIGSSGTTVVPTDKVQIIQQVLETAEEELPTALQGFITSDMAQNIGHAIFLGSVFDAETLAMFAQSGIIVGPGSGGNVLNLTQGMVLIAAKSDTEVQTREGKVFIPAGSIVLVYETGADSAVYDFVDKRKLVYIESNKQKLRMRPGEQIILTRASNGSFSPITPGKNVPYRNLKSHDLGAGITAHIGDFSILSAMNNYEPCVELRHSEKDAHKAAFEKMLKMAAAVQLATQHRGPYKEK